MTLGTLQFKKSPNFYPNSWDEFWVIEYGNGSTLKICKLQHDLIPPGLNKRKIYKIKFELKDNKLINLELYADK